MRALFRRPSVVVALAILAAMVLLALLAPAVAPFDPAAQPDPVAQQHLPPSVAHPFGTDRFSRDVLSRVLFGARVSLAVGVLAVAIAVALGTAWGAVAGYAGGAVDALLMRTVDALLAFPRILLLILVVALWGVLPIGALVLLLGATGWFGVSRLVRAEVRAAREREYVTAARALGASHARILLRHALPAAWAPLLVASTLGVGQAIVAEAGLSFLGIGVAPPTASWGSIMRDGLDVLASAWWVSLFPGLALVVTVLAVNVVADGLREVANPRQLPPP